MHSKLYGVPMVTLGDGRRSFSFHFSAVSNASRSNFCDVLQIGATFKAFGPRDYVYAFLGHPAAQVKYKTGAITDQQTTIGIEKLHWKVAKILLDDLDLPLRILSVAGYLKRNDQIRFPSWIPVE
jgi:hypothetical protein